MPNARASKQTLVNFWIDDRALAELDRVLLKLGYPDRSKFIREAICEELKRKGFEVPKEFFSSPSRIGKGGQPTHRRSRPGS